MNSREFFYLVAQMRAAQCEYFATKSQRALRKARALEGDVDREVRRVKAILNQQQ